jgi:hypothetical protein
VVDEGSGSVDGRRKRSDDASSKRTETEIIKKELPTLTIRNDASTCLLFAINLSPCIHKLQYYPHM